jgi:hypothetical protein
VPALRTRPEPRRTYRALRLLLLREAKAGGDCELQKNSGTCLGRRCHRWVLGEQSQSFPLAANMHIQVRRGNTQNVGGMVS